MLRKTLRKGDVAARRGGEEFVLLMPRATSQQAIEVIARIRANLAEAQLVGNSPVFTASFAVADSTLNSRFDQLIRVADDALYRAKDGGRDRAEFGEFGEFGEITGAVPRRAMEHPAAVDVTKLASGLDSARGSRGCAPRTLFSLS